MALIYIVEDDTNIQEIESFALKNSGYNVEGFENARGFFQKLAERVPDLILLDVMLPDMDGFEVDIKKAEKHSRLSEDPRDLCICENIRTG